MDASGAHRTVRVVSTKYDGSPHYEFDAQLLAHAGPMLTLLVPRGTPMEGYRGNLETSVTFTALFWTDRWYNVYHNHQPVGALRIMSYANVALPAELDGDTLRWVDLDLDLIVEADGRVFVVDEDEFAEHRRRFAYPQDVVSGAFAARDELLRLAEAGAFPFDRHAHVPPAQAPS